MTQLNGANLAYIGDAYYELRIRLYLIKKGLTKSKVLRQESIKYVSAHAHSIIVNRLYSQLTPLELQVFKRGRNGAIANYRKNVDQAEHALSSGFEAVLGYLFLEGNWCIQFATKTIEDLKDE